MSESVEEYLEAVYSFNERGLRAKNSDLADRLGVAPASVTQMIQRLAEENLIIYSPYKGVTLTGRGIARAQRIMRRHRLLERWLQETLCVPQEKVHGEACKIEHTLSDEVAAALCKHLDNPETCSDDGNPIPKCTFDSLGCEKCEEVRQGGEPTQLRTSLNNLTEGEEARVAFTRTQKHGAKKNLADSRIIPGAAIKVLNASPIEGSMEISVDGNRITVPRKSVEDVIVEFESGAQSKSHPHGPYHE